jgi:hypothetical protein
MVARSRRRPRREAPLYAIALETAASGGHADSVAARRPRIAEHRHSSSPTEALVHYPPSAAT